MLKVSLSVYSGREAPSWILSDEEETVLLDRIDADPGLMISTSESTRDPNTCYGGFVVQVIADGNPAKSRRYNSLGLPQHFRLGGWKAPDKAASQWLLGTADKRDSTVTPDTYNGAAHDILVSDADMKSVQTDDAPGHVAASPHTFTASASGVSPHCNYMILTSDTDFSPWNNDPNVTNWNCYNYASNYKSYDPNNQARFAQPGAWYSISRNSFAADYPNGWYWHVEFGPNFYDPNVEAGRDGHMPNACFGSSNRGFGPYTIVTALFIRTFAAQNPQGPDYHWMRLCANGHWCQKHGGQPVTNLDDSNNLVTDPSVANIATYTFCGYFGASVGGVNTSVRVAVPLALQNPDFA